MNQRFFLLYIYISIITLPACQHTNSNDSGFNLDFEDVESGMPRSWSVFSGQPDYAVSLESVKVKLGRYSMVIEFTGKAAGFQGILIQYFYPSKYLTDKEWSDVLKEYISYFIKASDRLEYELTASMLIGETGDTHAMYQCGFEETEIERGNKQAPVYVRFIGNKLVVTECYTEDVPLKKRRRHYSYSR